MQQQKTTNKYGQINISTNSQIFNAGSIWSKVLPVLLFFSFVWLELYSSVAKMATIGIVGQSSSLVISILFYGLFAYAIFEFLFLVYRFCLSFSLYSFLLPRQGFKDKFRKWFLIRNIILGFIFNLRFYFPYISAYLCIIELIFNMLLIIVLYYDVAKKHVEPLIGQFVFKILCIPMVLYEIYQVLSMMAGVL